jgi:copper resistance protein C
VNARQFAIYAAPISCASALSLALFHFDDMPQFHRHTHLRSRLMKKVLLSATIALATACICSHASAHAFLSKASPKVGSTISVSPPQITLTFTEGLEPAFSSVEVDGPNGAKIAADKARVSGKQMIVPLAKPLAPGNYHVVWRATAVDTHKTQGDFTFTVKP